MAHFLFACSLLFQYRIFWTRPCFAKRKILLNFNLQLVSPMKPCNVKGFAVFLESNMFVKVTESLSDLSVA